MLESALYIVPTPIGNLEDITQRAIEVLKGATLIACEDTRHSRILLDHLGVSGTRLMSCYDQVEAQKAECIISEVQQGGAVALISDAGSPLINDPGYKLVSLCVKAGIRVVPLPGPCALITALEVAALPTDRFMFCGFFPVKEGELREELKRAGELNCTCVYYESPKRILATSKQIAELLPEHPVAVCRELTKTFESCYRMRGVQLPEFIGSSSERQKGEFVVVIGGVAEQHTELPEEVQEVMLQLLPHLPVKQVCQLVSRLSRIPKNTLYSFALEHKAQG
ncbi:MAG: 16S rRNA (cytidine(1402)-2'-O)-methyltransferase [Succinivibrio sp.]|nr:16S rRNA (cytidine(1402)-2'-O)-methyltransferase [Succinivibrio sp.]